MWDQPVMIAAAPALVLFSAAVHWHQRRSGTPTFLWWFTVIFWGALVSTLSVAALTIPLAGEPYPYNVGSGIFVFISFVLAFGAVATSVALAQRLRAGAVLQASLGLVLSLGGFLVAPYVALTIACTIARECI